jgi:hypothetical protein
MPRPIENLEASAFWQRAARRTARKVNFGWWFERFAPLLVAASAGGFAVIFWLRSKQVALTLDNVWPWAALAFAILCASAFFLARRHFIGSEEALVRLEARLRLNNALTTAAHGMLPWPQPPAALADAYRWRWAWIVTPVLAAAACLAAAFWLPVRADAESGAHLTPPLAWPQMEDWLKKLEAEHVIDPAQLEELKQRLDALEAQPEHEWYAHNSLEATDNLRDGLQKSIGELGSQLQNAERSLNALQNYSEELSAAAREKLLNDFDAALQGLKANDLKLDPALMARLAALDPKQLKSLSAEQLNQLREAMKKKAGA